MKRSLVLSTYITPYNAQPQIKSNTYMRIGSRLDINGALSSQ